MSEFPKRYFGFNEDGKPVDLNGKVFKPCCVCRETKEKRDECVLHQDDCKDVIEQHIKCMQSYGFMLK